MFLNCDILKICVLTESAKQLYKSLVLVYRESVWLSTAPTETLTHWYQVRCLVETPVLVKQGQTLTGKCVLRCNKR